MTSQEQPQRRIWGIDYAEDRFGCGFRITALQPPKVAEEGRFKVMVNGHTFRKLQRVLTTKLRGIGSGFNNGHVDAKLLDLRCQTFVTGFKRASLSTVVANDRVGEMP